MDSINRLLARPRARDRAKTIHTATSQPHRLDRHWRVVKRGRSESAARESHGRRSLRGITVPALRR